MQTVCALFFHITRSLLLSHRVDPCTVHLSVQPKVDRELIIIIGIVWFCKKSRLWRFHNWLEVISCNNIQILDFSCISNFILLSYLYSCYHYTKINKKAWRHLWMLGLNLIKLCWLDTVTITSNSIERKACSVRMFFALNYHSAFSIQ